MCTRPDWLRAYLRKALDLDIPILEAISYSTYAQEPPSATEIKHYLKQLCLKRGFRKSCGFLTNDKVNLRIVTTGRENCNFLCIGVPCDITSGNQHLQWTCKLGSQCFLFRPSSNWQVKLCYPAWLGSIVREILL